jgi:predicted SnoaL-like aldol condensation-catalyzing enzyme
METRSSALRDQASSGLDKDLRLACAAVVGSGFTGIGPITMRVMALVLAVAFGTPLSASGQVPVKVLSPPEQLEALQDSDPKEAANKKLVYDFWREVFVGRDMSKAEQYLAESYIQHNPNVPTGRASFVAFFGRKPKEPARPAIDDLVAILGDGNLVTLAFRRELPDPAKPGATYTSTWFDMFRIEGGKIAEHWDYGTKSVPGAR